MKQCPPFTWRSEQKMIEGINGFVCYLVYEDLVPYDKHSIVTNYQVQRSPPLLMNSLHSKRCKTTWNSQNGRDLWPRQILQEIEGVRLHWTGSKAVVITVWEICVFTLIVNGGNWKKSFQQAQYCKKLTVYDCIRQAQKLLSLHSERSVCSQW